MPPLTDREKRELVDKLRTLRYRGGRMSRTTATPPINFFIHKRPGSFGQPVVTERDIRIHARKVKVIDAAIANVTVARQPWDRRPDETARQYDAFVHYRDQGVERTYTATMQELRIGSSSVALWKRVYQWASRVRSYDEYEEKRLRKITERAKKEMVERQARLGQTMTDKAQSALDSGMIQPETVADVVRLAETGTRIERLARGESTDNVAHGMSLILAHPLPPWAPDAAHQLVQENEYADEHESSQGPQTIDGDTGNVVER